MYEGNHSVYGARKVWHQLLREGISVARCTVARLMKAMGLAGVRRGKKVRTTVTPKTSAERHARQYVYAADDGFNPNFYVKKADSTRMMVPFFRQFHDMGVKDRAAGVSREETQQRVSQFRSEEFLKSIQSEEEFAGRTYNDSSTPSPKELKAMGDAISATYMDGYEGIK